MHRHKPKARKARSFNRKKKPEIDEDTWMPIFQVQVHVVPLPNGVELKLYLLICVRADNGAS